MEGSSALLGVAFVNRFPSYTLLFVRVAMWWMQIPVWYSAARLGDFLAGGKVGCWGLMAGGRDGDWW